MSEAKQILEAIIDDFAPEKFNRFFREKSRHFANREENYSRYSDDDFRNGIKLGEIRFLDSDSLLVCVFEVQKPLSERAGKKAQYEKAKAILKSTENRIYSAGIFIFYDTGGNFRFSLVYPEAVGDRRQWNSFRRFTYFVSSELTNKTFKQRIGEGDFSGFEKIKDAFSVEKVTREFYQDIANWYFWAVDNCEFPKDAEAEENGRNIAVIRLITRMIFIWFMRERGLVPNLLFKKEDIIKILQNLNAGESTYYKAILQNLFFAALSTKKEERQFSSEIRGNKGYNPDFDNQYVFRYHELFKNPDEIQNYFGDIPFLNGGLFECLDDKRNEIIIDGFSRTKKNQPAVPNFLFFSAEKKADLNKAFGTKGKSYKVRGLLDTLSSFNFTIDENSPDDADVALDPELLGRVFENLLASFNPETSTTARKATGSYYTPREIVDYMVTESLKAYFKTHLENIDEKLENLFSKVNEHNPLESEESKKMVLLIENVKIVDPAVGSGAFPMGALNKLVFILNKLDPGNELWNQAQLKAADVIPDPSARRLAKEKIQEFFQGKNADYGRKLYLIQKCIYGVDIQQIAVEIAKLRFFISLLVEEKIDKTKDNWGIEPLPNLDFKIMQGNSLISEFLGIDFDNGKGKESKEEQEVFLFEHEEDILIKEFEQKKIDFQNEADKDEKKMLKEKVEDLMIRIFENKLAQKIAELRKIEEKAQQAWPSNQKIRDEYTKTEKARISQKHGFDLENIEKQLLEFTSKKKTRTFFPWKLYFAEVFEKGGFDIVIGNPPYVRVDEIAENIKIQLKNIYKSCIGKYDLYYLFIEKGFYLLKMFGNLVFITPNKFCASSFGKSLREIIFSNVGFGEIISTSMLNVFKEASNYPIISILHKNQDASTLMIREALSIEKIDESTNSQYRLPIKSFDIFPDKIIPINVDQYSVDFVIRLLKKSTRFGYYFSISEGLRIPAKYELENDSDFKIVKQFQFEKWSSIIKGNFISREHLKKIITETSSRFKKINESKILIAEDALEITATLDEFKHIPQGGVYFGTVTNSNINIKAILAILNSKLLSKIYKFLFSGMHMGGGYLRYRTNFLEELPLPEGFSKYSLNFENITNKILAITKSADYLQNPDKQSHVNEYEKQIDRLVYELYGLTPEEIAIVEGKSQK